MPYVDQEVIYDVLSSVLLRFGIDSVCREHTADICVIPISLRLRTTRPQSLNPAVLLLFPRGVDVSEE